MYMQFVVLGHEYTPVTSVSTTKEPTIIFKGYSQLYKRKREYLHVRHILSTANTVLCETYVLQLHALAWLWTY